MRALGPTGGTISSPTQPDNTTPFRGSIFMLRCDRNGHERLKCEITNLQLDTPELAGISSDGVQSRAVQSTISDFGFEVGFSPISQLPSKPIKRVREEVRKPILFRG